MNEETRHIKENIKSIQANLKRFKDKETVKLLNVSLKKLYNLLFKIYSINIIKNENRRQQIEVCGDFLSFLKGKDEKQKELFIKSKKKIDVYNYRLVKATFCRHRLCNMCMWRKSVADSIKIQTIFNFIKSQKDYNKCNKYKLLFLTLTVKNCEFNELESTIDRINKSFLNFIRNKKIKENILGTIKKIEVTFNHDTQTWHPHIHCVLLVYSSYADLAFKNKTNVSDKRVTKVDNYISQQEFLEMWQRAYNDYTISQVDVRVVKDFEKASKELSKYVAKASNLISYDKDDLYNIRLLTSYFKQTYNKRFITFVGEFKKLNKAFKEHKLDEFLPVDDTDYYLMWEGIFEKTVYDLQTRTLTDEEKEQYLNKSTHYEFDYSSND